MQSEEQMPEQYEEQIPDVVTEDRAPDMSIRQYADAYTSQLIYLLEFNIPEKYHEEFEKYKPVLSQTLAVANIKREDLTYYATHFSLIIDYYRINQPKEARKLMVEMIVKLSLTRSVNGFERRMQQTSRREHSLEGFRRGGGQGQENEEKKKRKFGFWRKK